MNPVTIEALHRAKQGKLSDKWESYLKYYDFLFGPLREQPLQLLEIGVQNGGSLDTWSSYFKNATHLVGCDIDEKCGNLVYDDPRIHVVVGNANSNEAYQAIRAIAPQYDVIIDDGSHISQDIFFAFINYFPLVKPGGIFVIEDIHTLYMDNFGGGVLNEGSVFNLFKKLTDVVNYQFWRKDLDLKNYLRTFFNLGSTPAFIQEGWIEAIEFRNSIITIRRAETAGHEKIGERVLAGTDAAVQDWGGVITNPLASTTSPT